MPFFTIALALAACTADETPAAQSSTDAPDSIASNNGAMDASRPADGSPTGQSQRISVRGFEWGDNCYLDYSLIASAADPDPVEETRSALCNVDACLPWFEEQAIPPELVGRTAIVTIGTGEQYDNAGNIMDDNFPLITSIRVDP
ncbi:unnamed protein product, partial [Ectocarpus sp. 8 AP-2014]